MHMNDHGISHRTILSKIRTITRATIGNSTKGDNVGKWHANDRRTHGDVIERSRDNYE